MKAVKMGSYSPERSLSSLLGLVLAAALFAMPALAQDGASLSGRVTDVTEAAIPGAAVRIVNRETGAERNLVSDDAGRFSAQSLPVGRYDLTVTKEGFRIGTRNDIELAVGYREQVDLTLKIGDVHEAIVVTDDSGTLLGTTEDVSGVVGERQVKDLPLNGRSYDQLVTLNPGILNYSSQRAGGIGTSNSAVGNMFSASGRRPRKIFTF